MGRAGRPACGRTLGCCWLGFWWFAVFFISRREAPPMGRADRPAHGRALGCIGSMLRWMLGVVF